MAEVGQLTLFLLSRRRAEHRHVDQVLPRRKTTCRAHTGNETESEREIRGSCAGLERRRFDGFAKPAGVTVAV